MALVVKGGILSDVRHKMKELHAQHRNKLEDITRRFESIKLSLSEKVQSLCVECDELRFRAKTSEDALQRDADVKVQMALAPYLNLPQEIESLRTVIDMRTEEIQKLRRQNMDLEKQLEELPIAQEKVVSLQQKVENLQAIINIKTDHEKQLHEKCQVLMRKYDRESRANKRLSMDYEQAVWRMSQSADFSGSVDSLTARQLSHSPTSGDQQQQQQQQQQQRSRTSPSPVRRTHSSTPSTDNANGSTGVTRRQRRISAGDEDYDRRIRCRSATFSLDKSRGQHAPTKGEGATGVNGTSSGGRAPSKLPVMAKSGDYTALIVAAMDTGHDESFSSGHESGDTSDFQSSMESSVILETAQGLSYNISVADSVNGVAEPDREASSKLDDVFVEEACVQSDTAGVPADAGVQSGDVAGRTDVTVVVVSPSSE